MYIEPDARTDKEKKQYVLRRQRASRKKELQDALDMAQKAILTLRLTPQLANDEKSLRELLEIIQTPKAIQAETPMERLERISQRLHHKTNWQRIDSHVDCIYQCCKEYRNAGARIKKRRESADRGSLTKYGT